MEYDFVIQIIINVNIMANKINLQLTSGGTIDQGVVTKGGGKMLSTYTRNAGKIFIDPEDMKSLGVMPNSPVKVTSAFNEVIVFAQQSPDAPHKGVGFMPRGPWCNLLVNPETYNSGCAMFKQTDITVEPATNGEVPLDMPKLIKAYYLDKIAS